MTLHGERLTRTETRLDHLAEKIETVDTKVDTLDAKVDRVLLELARKPNSTPPRERGFYVSKGAISAASLFVGGVIVAVVQALWN